ncbi:MAG: HDOD domain-containing protein [Planctomycetes bacterium]|nr:HDOD domain-containing protein [Planctomycetota bacterium]
MEKYKKLLDQVRDLPTLPEVVKKLNSMLSNPKTTAKEVTQVISKDPSITTKLLRIVNSSFYSFTNPVNKISMAVIVLGFNSIKSIVLGTSVFGAFKSGRKPSFDYQGFWLHAVCVGAAARIIAKRLGKKETEPYFIAGLVSELGLVLGDQYFQEEFSKVVENVRTKKSSILVAEKEVFGGHLNDLAAYLLEKWELSSNIVDAVRHKYDPLSAKEDPEFASMLLTAECIARTLYIGEWGDKTIPDLSQSVIDKIQVKSEDFRDLLDKTSVEFEKAKVFIEAN